jgi:hypothetical protein
MAFNNRVSTVLLILCCYPFVELSSVIEHPEDVTVVMGDPATLICRVDTGFVKWFKDGVEMKIEDEEEIFVLPDGSLFFLSPKAGDTALYNCGIYGEDGNTNFSDPAALIVANTTDPLKQGDDEISVNINVEFKEEALKPIHVEVINDEVPPTVYIISMVIVGAITIMIIAGAAIIFTKIKQMPRKNGPEAGDRYWQTPMMYSNKTLDVIDSGWRNGSRSPWDLYSGSVHHYARPIDIFGGGYSEKSSHYASSNVEEGKSRLPDNSYQRLSPINLLSHNQSLL